MPKRKAISKKARFEVFKRDSFTCQYCGAAAPETVLHVDHIKPVAKGGGNEIMNLVTACAGCNGGKGATELNDSSAVQRQKRQMDELNDRREQLEMMMQWRDGLKDITESSVDVVVDRFSEMSGHTRILSEVGKKDVKKLVRKYGLNSVLDAMDIAEDRYVEFDAEGVPTAESCRNALSKVSGICYMRSLPEDRQQLSYIRAIVNKRMYCNWAYAMELLEDALEAGNDIECLKRWARRARDWAEWQEGMHDLILSPEVA
jgi:hypothetical protein